jgi:acetyl-CoA C-acetyltransferase
MKDVFIVAAMRTPLGSFGGSLASFSATKLGAAAIKAAIQQINLDVTQVDEVIMGCVLQANLGQAPARQAAKFAGLPDQVNCTTVNKVCASGMKAVMQAAQSIRCGDADVIIAGGMESMSQVPFYSENMRWGNKYGHTQMIDGLAKDGLTDVYHNYAMGVAADMCAKECNITREAQDAFAMESYTRSANAWKSGKFTREVTPMQWTGRKGETITFAEDEEFKSVQFDKIPSLKPVFTKDGSVTAANASTMNDGAAALILMSGEKMKSLGYTPIARVASYADAEQAPEWFTTSPALALPKAAAKAGIDVKQLDFVELNEAFSVVGIVNMQKMGLDSSKVNLYGGAVSLGHPLGCSGARILVTLISVMLQEGGKWGGAGICNGGGGASAVILEAC